MKESYRKGIANHPDPEPCLCRRKAVGEALQSETPGMSGNSMRESREAPLVTGSSKPERQEKATSYTTSMSM